MRSGLALRVRKCIGQFRWRQDAKVCRQWLARLCIRACLWRRSDITGSGPVGSEGQIVTTL